MPIIGCTTSCHHRVYHIHAAKANGLFHLPTPLSLFAQGSKRAQFMVARGQQGASGPVPSMPQKSLSPFEVAASAPYVAKPVSAPPMRRPQPSFNGASRDLTPWERPIIPRSPWPSGLVPPSAPRPVFLRQGFQNMGNTCYLNAVVASLMHLPPFVRALRGAALAEAVAAAEAEAAAEEGSRGSAPGPGPAPTPPRTSSAPSSTPTALASSAATPLPSTPALGAAAPPSGHSVASGPSRSGAGTASRDVVQASPSKRQRRDGNGAASCTVDVIVLDEEDEDEVEVVSVAVATVGARRGRGADNGGVAQAAAASPAGTNLMDRAATSTPSAPTSVSASPLGGASASTPTAGGGGATDPPASTCKPGGPLPAPGTRVFKAFKGIADAKLGSTDVITPIELKKVGAPDGTGLPSRGLQLVRVC